MAREFPKDYLKIIVTLAGSVCLGVCLLTFPFAAMNYWYLGMIGFTILIIPRMSLTIPRSEVAVSFSDSLVFLAFLVYGPAPAIVLSATETLANCYYNK